MIAMGLNKVDSVTERSWKIAECLDFYLGSKAGVCK